MVVTSQKRRKQAEVGQAKMSQKAIALTVGASQDRSVWTKESMAAAVRHLIKTDASKPAKSYLPPAS